jgi:hypothetical protein
LQVDRVCFCTFCRRRNKLFVFVRSSSSLAHAARARARAFSKTLSLSASVDSYLLGEYKRKQHSLILLLENMSQKTPKSICPYKGQPISYTVLSLLLFLLLLLRAMIKFRRVEQGCTWPAMSSLTGRTHGFSSPFLNCVAYQ